MTTVVVTQCHIQQNEGQLKSSLIMCWLRHFLHSPELIYSAFMHCWNVRIIFYRNFSSWPPSTTNLILTPKGQTNIPQDRRLLPQQWKQNTTLKMKAPCFSEILVPTDQITHCHYPDHPFLKIINFLCCATFHYFSWFIRKSVNTSIG